jgi:hypothetical protein
MNGKYSPASLLPRFVSKRYVRQILGVPELSMPLTLYDVRHDPIANRALEHLTRRYRVAEHKSGLILTKKTGDMKLFLYDLDDLHQWDFVHNQKMVQEIERLRTMSHKIYNEREKWKNRALLAEATSGEAAVQPAKKGRQNVSDFRFAALKRYLAKRLHPDYAPGEGIEKLVRAEIFKEIWTEVERLDDQALSAA